MINARCNNKQEVVLTVSPVDGEPDPQPVKLDADAVKVTVVTGDSTASVSQLENGSFEVVLRSADTKGLTTFKLSGDALPGEGVEIIEEDLELEVVGVAAVSLGIAITAVRAKSPLPTP